MTATISPQVPTRLEIIARDESSGLLDRGKINFMVAALDAIDAGIAWPERSAKSRIDLHKAFSVAVADRVGTLARSEAPQDVAKANAILDALSGLLSATLRSNSAATRGAFPRHRQLRANHAWAGHLAIPRK